MDRGAKALVNIRRAVEQYDRTDRPVTAILAVTLRTDFVRDLAPDQLRRERSRLHRVLLQDFTRRVNDGVLVDAGLRVQMDFLPASAHSTYFYTRSGWNAQTKAAALKEMTRRANAAWARRIGADHVFVSGRTRIPGVRSVSVNFLLSTPLTYMNLRPPQDDADEDGDNGDEDEDEDDDDDDDSFDEEKGRPVPDGSQQAPRAAAESQSPSKRQRSDSATGQDGLPAMPPVTEALQARVVKTPSY